MLKRPAAALRLGEEDEGIVVIVDGEGVLPASGCVGGCCGAAAAAAKVGLGKFV